MMRLSCFLTSIFLFAGSIYSGSAVAKTQLNPSKYPGFKVSKENRLTKPKIYMTKKKFKKYMKTVVPKEKRFVASTPSLTEKDISTEAQKLIDSLLSANSANKLSALIIEVDKKYDSYKNQDSKFLAALISPAKDFRGILYKLRPLFEKSKSTHSLAVTGIRTSVGLSTVYLPQDHWQAGVDFAAGPSESDITTFRDVDQLLSFSKNIVYPELLKMRSRINDLDFEGKNRIVWDNRIFSNSKNFGDDLDRFRLIGEADRLNLMAGINNSLYAISMSQAYNIKGLLTVSDRLGNLIGLDKVTAFGVVDGATAKDRTMAVTKKIGKSNDLFTLNKDGKKWIKDFAFVYLKEATRFAELAWEITKDSNDEEWSILDPALAKPFARQTNMSFKTVNRMLDGKTTVRSNVNGKTLEVDLKSFFTNPPNDLKAFLPTGFAGEAKEPSKLTVGNVSYRNYRHGNATAWRASAYSPYFPGISGDKIPEAASILSQTWGAWGVAAPLSLAF
jgi:hypothetical protein